MDIMVSRKKIFQHSYHDVCITVSVSVLVLRAVQNTYDVNSNLAPKTE